MRFLVFVLGYNKVEGMTFCYDNEWRKVPDKLRGFMTEVRWYLLMSGFLSLNWDLRVI